MLTYKFTVLAFPHQTLVKKKDIFKIHISGAVEFGYALWLLQLSKQ